MNNKPSKSMINGTVGLMSQQALWGDSNTQSLLATVNVSGIKMNQLEFRSAASGKKLSYRLLDKSSKEIRVWKFMSHWGKKTLNLHSSNSYNNDKLEYCIGLFGGTYFRTEEGKKPIYMDLTEHSRGFELDEMFFKHLDFKSHIHFRCEESKLYQAILIASLIFNPPMTTEASD